MTTAEWKEGYRDGLTAGVAVARTCAADPTATPQDVVNLLEVLAASHVLDTKEGQTDG